MFVLAQKLNRFAFFSQMKPVDKPPTCASPVPLGKAAVALIAAAVLGGLLLAPAAAQAQSPPVWTPFIGGPLPRSSPAMTYDSTRKVSVMFGGGDVPIVGYTNETWEWDGVVWNLRQPTSGSPSARNRMAMAFDPIRGQVVMFGGGSGSYTDETWVWNGSSWQARAPFPSNTKPQARSNHAMAFDADPSRRNIVLFGGLLPGNDAAGDTWIWNGTTWSQRFVPGPSARSGHQMVYDSGRNVIVLFGGTSTTPSIIPNNETWEWNGSVWNQRTISGPSPSPRSRHIMTYDSQLQRVILYGGRVGVSSQLNDETWDYDGALGVWSQRVEPSPGLRSDHTATYDSFKRTTFTFGGTSGTGISGEFWGFGDPCLPPVIAAQDFGQTLCPGNTATLGVTVAGSAPLSYQWRKAGLPIEATANATAITASLVLPNITDDDSGLYDCVITNPCNTTTSSPARLTARSPADIAGGGSDGNQPDGIVDGNDFIAFINAFAAGC